MYISYYIYIIYIIKYNKYIGCLFIGILSQFGLIPFFGKIFGNVYEYYDSTSVSTSITPVVISSSSSSSSSSNSNNRDSILDDNTKNSISNNKNINNKMKKEQNKIWMKRFYTDNNDINIDTYESQLTDEEKKQYNAFINELSTLDMSIDDLIDDDLDDDDHIFMHKYI
jgi:hypothetical protein